MTRHGIPISKDVAVALAAQAHAKDEIERFEADLPLRKMDRTRVFVSYSHEDVASVGPVLQVLQRSKVSIFIDEKNIEFGKLLAERVNSGLRKCTHYLLLLSANSAESQWCTYEYAVAETLGLELLVFKLDESVGIPHAMSYRLATANLDDVGERLASDRLDLDAAARFVTEENRGLHIRRGDATRLTIHRERDDIESWDLPAEEQRSGQRDKLTGCWIADPGTASVGLIYGGSEVWLLQYDEALQATEILDLENQRSFSTHSAGLRTSDVADLPEREWRSALRWDSIMDRWDATHRFIAQRLDRKEAPASWAVDRVSKNALPLPIEGWEMSEDFWAAAVNHLRELLPR